MSELGERFSEEIQPFLRALEAQNIVPRIWAKDHTVWKPTPREITDRLGWLTIVPEMQSRIGEIEAFAAEARRNGFQRVVLLGMGGSSLAPEVFRRTFAGAPGLPEFIVLDSILPETVLELTGRIDPSRTLFIVSSKSGTTIEIVCLLEYFWSLVAAAVGERHAGARFVAITDPRTPLAQIGAERAFRRVFPNPPDIGGRYSVLSYFGLVPAVLMGMDIGLLLERAGRMVEASAAGRPIAENAGAWLGAAIGGMALKGKDKLTLLASPKIRAFGLWLEQLIAESLGKEGKGIVPVAEEPLVGADRYDDDRLFVYLRMEGDRNAPVDKAVESLRSSGHPVIVLPLRDTYDLGAEFFRWEFATAMAGAVLGVHPFNQPNVQQAKDATNRVLAASCERGNMSESSEGETDRLFEKLGRGQYFAVLAYLPESPPVDEALAQLRRRVLARYRVATMSGYGPRYLHSAGQLHKGGPDTGVFLQFTMRHAADVPIPGKPYTFGALADAQALGDLQTLRELGRPVATVNLPSGTPDEIARHIARVGRF